MKIFVICSKAFYPLIHGIKRTLEESGHEVLLPNCYDNPELEDQMKHLSDKEHSIFKASMIRRSELVISNVDSVLVLNFSKNGIPGYIGGATFLEMYNAFRLDKSIYMFNGVSDSSLSDEIKGFSPTIINGDLSRLKLKGELNND